MKIFDCFMYFDEDLILDLRLNYLNKYVDYFVVVESKFNHNGERREPCFNINKYKKFKEKIIYLLVNDVGNNFHKIHEQDDKNKVAGKNLMNAVIRENYQRNFIINGLSKAEDEDWIIISDLDEIPNLEVNNLKDSKNNFVFFNQLMIYYKLNLYLQDFPWVGSKACKKKYLKSPQWLRNIKDRIYPWWRLDILFSEKKFSDIKLYQNGGWHFSYIKNPKDIEKKLKSYLHHTEYELNPIGSNKISELIRERKTVYNLKADMRSNKFQEGNLLQKLNMSLLPSYVNENLDKYLEWIEK